jgi:glutaredoxin-like YruB-family protein
MNTKKVAIYTTPSCVYCQMTKDFFQDKGVQYEEYNVQSDTGRREEMVKKSGQMGVPVIVIGETDGQQDIVIGFDQPQLSQLLGL